MAENLTPAGKRLLVAAGCRFVRQRKGDHGIWYSPINNWHFMVDAKIKLRIWANQTLKAGWVTQVLLSREEESRAAVLTD
jgi:hypothetical protein